MGCQQSKFNFLYRWNRNSKRDSKTVISVMLSCLQLNEAPGTSDSEEDESIDEVTPEETEPEIHHHDTIEDISQDISEEVSEGSSQDTSRDVLPISEHQPVIEVSPSQQTFFRMLDEKIAQGNDYDSSSETEIQKEEERKQKIIELWNTYSQLGQSSVSRAGPPTPAGKHRLTRSVSKISQRQCTPITGNKCYQQTTSPPTRRHHGVQTHDPRPSTSSESEPCKTMKRTQSAGRTWRNKPKVAPLPQQKQEEPVAGSSKDPTIQNHSPGHSINTQPCKTQMVSCPLTEQVAPVSPAKFIAPPDEYNDSDITRIEKTVTVSQTESHVYFIHGKDTATASDIVQQRQRTALNLQQYVAMKQAQQQIFSAYTKRSPDVVFPGGDLPAITPRMREGEELAAQYGYPGLRPQTAPGRTGSTDITHVNTPTWNNTLPPVMTTQWAGGEVPLEMQYYPQSQFVPLYRANSVRAAGTLKKEETGKTVQVISVIRKPVGQIVAVGGQELAVSSTVSDTPSPASVSTDSGVSTSAPSSNTSFISTPTTNANETDPKSKNKSSAKRTLKPSKSYDA